MKIYRLLLMLLLAAAILCLFPAIALANYTTPLVAGGGNGLGTQVGTVEVWNDADYLYVRYLVLDSTPTIPWDNWMLVETHLAVTGRLGAIPQKNGNPIPGKFEFSRQHGLFTNSYTYEIPRSEMPAGASSLFIAAHGVVKRLGGAGALAYWLPDMVDLDIKGALPGDASYMQVRIQNDTFLNGIHPAWCVDTTRMIDAFVPYKALVFSSYETLPAGLVEYPQNLDLANWIINQGFVGAAFSGGEVYTYGDVQRAIWTLLASWLPNEPGDNTSPWDQDHVNAIVAAAQAHDGFEPGYGQYMLVLLQPVDQECNPYAQVIGIPYKIVWTAGNETAWARGAGFRGANWAMYFGYTLQ